MEVKRPVSLLNVGHVEQTPEEEYVRNVMKPTEPYACAWHDVKPERFIVADKRESYSPQIPQLKGRSAFMTATFGLKR